MTLEGGRIFKATRPLDPGHDNDSFPDKSCLNRSRELFAPSHKNVSEQVIDKLLTALNSENIAGLLAEGDPINQGRTIIIEEITHLPRNGTD